MGKKTDRVIAGVATGAWIAGVVLSAPARAARKKREKKQK